MIGPLKNPRGLPASARILARAEFARLNATGKRLINGCLIANWILLTPGDSSRLGVISSRKLGPAPLRNRARRLLREAFRLHRNELAAPIALVLVARASIEGMSLAEVERDLLATLRKGKVLP